MHVKTSSHTSFKQVPLLHHVSKLLTATVACAALLCLCSNVSFASACSTLGGTVSKWIDGNGNWNKAANWDNGIPNGSTDSACIADGSSTVTLDINASVDDLEIGSGNTLDFNRGLDLRVYGTQILNAGRINVNGGGGTNAYLYIPGFVTLSGGGILNLDTTTAGGGGNAHLYLYNAGGLDNIDNTIQGTGIIYNGGSGGFINEAGGVINANSAGAPLISTLTLQNGTYINWGLMEATNNGILVLSSTTIDNSSVVKSGVITTVDSTAAVQIRNSTIIGGTLNNTGGGFLGVPGGYNGYLDGTSSAVTINGQYTSDFNGDTYLYGAISVVGDLLVKGGGGNNTYLRINGNTVALTGGGTISLYTTTAGGGGNAYIYLYNNGLLDNVNNTIQGEGVISNNNTTIINEPSGVINANSPGGQLVDYLNITGGTIYNRGLMEATTGRLVLQSTFVDNAGFGVIAANGPGASVQFVSGTVIQGGTLQNNGGAFLGVPGGHSAHLDGATPTGPVNIVGTYTLDFNSNTYLYGVIINNGDMLVNGGNGNNTYLRAPGGTPLTLMGGGSVSLYTTTEHGGGNAHLYIYNGGWLDNVDNTIQGEGLILNNGTTIFNEAPAVINANSPGGLLVDYLTITGGLIYNQGLMEATTGRLVLEATIVDNTVGGVIAANAPGGIVQLISGTTVLGGTLNNNGGAFLGTPNNTSAYLDGSSSAGAINLLGTYTSALNTNTYLYGTIHNQGDLLVQGGNGTNTYLRVPGSNVTLTGGGTVTLNTSTQYGGGNAHLYIYNGGTLDNIDNTIQGEGYIVNNGGVIRNHPNGYINANSTGAPLVDYLDLQGGTVFNEGVLEATLNGRLVLENATIENAGGTIRAIGAGASVQLVNGTTVRGGTLANLGGAFLGTRAGTNATLDGASGAGAITLLGTYTTDFNADTYLYGTINNQGELLVNGGNGNNTYLRVPGSTLTLTGGGVLSLFTSTEHGGGNAHLYLYNGATLDNIDNTIQGEGIVYNYGATLINEIGGTILANSPGAPLISSLSIQGGTLTNYGLLQANPGDLLHLYQLTLTNYNANTLTAGSYSVYGTSTSPGWLQIDYLGNTGGEIITNAASILLDGPNSNFVDAANKDALSKLAVNTAQGSFTIQNGRNFTSPGDFSNGGSVFVGAGSIFTSTGNYNQSGGSTKLDGALIASGGQANFNGGMLLGNGGIVTGNVKMAGTLAPGDDVAMAGKLTISGNYVQTGSGTFQLDIGGLIAGSQFDLLDVSGNALLDGTLSVDLINGFFPSIGDTFTFLNTGGTRSGLFATETGLILGNNEKFDVIYGSDFVQLVTTYFSTADSWLGGMGNWSDAGKWDIGVPTPGFDVTIYSGGNDHVTLDVGSASINSLGLGGGINGFTSELTDAGVAQSLSIRQGLTIGQQGVLSLTGNGSSVSAASVSNSGSVFIGQGATLMTTAGNYSQSIGMTKVDGALVANGGQANFFGGTLLGNGGVVTGNMSMGGILSPGEGAGMAGMLTINGNYTQTATGLFDLDIGGYTAGTEFDFLKVNGQAFLDGTLDINIINGFTLQNGDTFVFLLTDPGVFGTFATINGWDLGYGYFQVIYELNQVELAFTTNTVPEPDICLMLGAGLLGIAFAARRRWLK